MPQKHHPQWLVSGDLSEHDYILTNTSAVFQAGGLVVILVEVGRKAYLASMVPVIVNAVLNEHQLIVDIVAFVSKGDFPRSRLGEKQRGKILASWVTRKLRTIAQFSIRENDGTDSQVTEVGDPRASTIAASTLGGSSLRQVETQSPPAKEHNAQDYTSLPTGISEMPAYETSIIESPPIGTTNEDKDDTPTDTRHMHFDQHTPKPIEHNGFTTATRTHTAFSSGNQQQHTIHTSTASTAPEPLDYKTSATNNGPLDDPPNSFNFNTSSYSLPPPEPSYSSKPVLELSHERDPQWSNRLHHSSNSNDPFTLQSAPQQISYNRGQEQGNGGQEPWHSSNETTGSGDEWRRDAVRSMQFGRGQNPGQAGHDRQGYNGRWQGYGHAL